LYTIGHSRMLYITTAQRYTEKNKVVAVVRSFHSVHSISMPIQAVIPSTLQSCPRTLLIARTKIIVGASVVASAGATTLHSLDPNSSESYATQTLAIATDLRKEMLASTVHY
jgi:hypothetical protein